MCTRPTIVRRIAFSLSGEMQEIKRAGHCLPKCRTKSGIVVPSATFSLSKENTQGSSEIVIFKVNSRSRRKKKKFGFWEAQNFEKDQHPKRKILIPAVVFETSP